MTTSPAPQGAVIEVLRVTQVHDHLPLWWCDGMSVPHFLDWLLTNIVIDQGGLALNVPAGDLTDSIQFETMYLLAAAC